MEPTDEITNPESGSPRSWRSASWHLICACLHWVLVIGACLCFLGASRRELWLVLAVPSFLFALWLVTFIHELGHAVATKLCGWRIVAFAAGPIGLHLVNRRLALVHKSKRLEIEGFVLPVPRNEEVWTAKRAALIYAGGPAATALFAVAALLIAKLVQGVGGDFAVHLLLIGFALVSLATLVSTALPPAGGSNDASAIKCLMGIAPDIWLQHRAMGAIHGLLQHQVRLRALPMWMVEEVRVQALRADSDLQQGYDTLLIGIILDSPPVDFVEARTLVDEFRAKYGSSPWLDFCDAYLAAIWEKDAISARKLLWRSEYQSSLRPLARAAEAALLAREGKFDCARASIEDMRAAVARNSIFPDATFLDIEAQIRALLPDGSELKLEGPHDRGRAVPAQDDAVALEPAP